MSGEELREGAKTWWLDRAREPSTYQGLALLAGVLGQAQFGGRSIGQHALDIGLGIAGGVPDFPLPRAGPRHRPHVGL